MYATTAIYTYCLVFNHSFLENKCNTQLGEIDKHVNSACPILQEKIISHSVTSQSFTEALTLSLQYLPKKKQNKLKATGKPKLPAVGTSDDWWRVQMKKEQQQKMKEEKFLQEKS